MIYAHGVGPLNRTTIRNAVGKVFNKVDVITVRDAESKQLLEDIGVRTPNIHLSADPALVLTPNIQAADKIISEQGLAEKELIGVSLRPWAGAERQLAEAVKGISEAAMELEVNLALIPMQESEDCGACEAISGGVFLKGAGRPDVVKGLISKCGMVVGMRLHALILAAGEGVPIVALSYDPKVNSFATSAGCESQIDIQNLSSDEVKNAVIKVWNERAITAENIKKRAGELRALAIQSGNIAKGILG